MKRNKGNNTNKGKKQDKELGSSKSNAGYRPAATDLATRAKALSGIKSRNMSISNVPSSRSGYPYLFEVGTSETFNALNSGLSGSWKATMFNFVNQGDADLVEAMALYNVGTSEKSKERMTARLGQERPLCFKSRARHMFYNRPNKESISSKITPYDGIVAVEEWHKEFSREIGMHVKWLMHNINVSRTFLDQRNQGPYGLDTDRHLKANGSARTPYEHLYNELYEQMPHPDVLNVPSHLQANLTLEDLAVHCLQLLSPTSAGMINDHWTFSSHVNIHEEAFLEGYESLDFGLTTDNDGTPRYVIQPPTIRVEARTSSDSEQSVLKGTRVPTDRLFSKGTDGMYTLDTRTLGSPGMLVGSALSMLASGVPYQQLGGTTDTLPITGGGVIDHLGNVVPAGLGGGFTILADEMSSYEPLAGSLSSWVLSDERARYTDEVLRVMPDPASFKVAATEVQTAFEQAQQSIAGGLLLVDAGNINDANAAYWIYQSIATTISGAPLPDVTSQPYQLGDYYPSTGIDPEVISTLMATSATLRYTSKLWVRPTNEIVTWCKMVADALPPAYLATGYPQVTGFKTELNMQVSAAFNMNRVTDMINLSCLYRPKFNPIKNIDANNGPFWDSKERAAGFLEEFWLSSELDSGSFDDQQAALQTVFSGLAIDHGIGQGGILLSDLFALMNPRWCNALWNISSKSSLSKHERYVAVPANRIAPNDTYASAEGEHKFSHLELLVYRLWGSFRCRTTAPLADIDYDKIDHADIKASGQLGIKINNLSTPAAPDAPIGGVIDFSSTNIDYAVRDQTSAELMYGRFGTYYAVDQIFTTVGDLEVEIPWNAIERDSELDVGFRMESTDGLTSKGMITTKTLKTDAGSVLSAQLRHMTPGFKVASAELTVPGQMGAYTTIADIDFIPADGDTSSGKIELAQLAGRPATTITGWWGSMPIPASLFWATSECDLTSVKLVSQFGTKSGTQKEFNNFHVKCTSSFTDDITSGMDFTTLKSAAEFKAAIGDGVQCNVYLYEAKITGKAWMSTDSATIVPTLQDIVKGSISFVLYEFEGDLSSEMRYVPLSSFGAIPDSGVLASVGWPEFEVDLASGAPNASPSQIAAWVIIDAFPKAQYPDVGLNLASPSGALGLGALSTEVGGTEDVYTEGYLLPENEDIWYDQRIHEMDAAVLSYSEGTYYPTHLSSLPGRKMYPYHRELRGFKRALIQTLQPELTRLHRLSVSPFATDNKNHLRVIKTVYIQTDYMHGYVALAEQAAGLYSTMSLDSLLAAQDVLVRSGQIGS